MKLQTVYGHRCACTGNCTHSFWITVIDRDTEQQVAARWRSGGMLPDKYKPSIETFRAAEHASQTGGCMRDD